MRGLATFLLSTVCPLILGKPQYGAAPVQTPVAAPQINQAPQISCITTQETVRHLFFLNFTIVLNSQLCRFGTPSTLRRRRRSATRSRYSSSDNPARQSTRTPVKPSTNRWNQDNRNHPLWKSCLNLDCKKCNNSLQVCSQQYRQESQPYTETECSSQVM